MSGNGRPNSQETQDGGAGAQRDRAPRNATGPIANGVYHIYSTRHGISSTLSMVKSNNEELAMITARPEQEEEDHDLQEWLVTYTPESRTYTLFNVGRRLYASFVFTAVIPTAIWLRGSLRPYQWRIEAEDGADEFSVSVKSTDQNIVLYNLSAAPGTGAQLWPRSRTPVPDRTWTFSEVESESPPPSRPLSTVATLPSLQAGTYRVRNTSSRTVMTQHSAGTPNYPQVTGQTSRLDNVFQEWEITIHQPSQTFFIRNRGSGEWLGIPERAEDTSPLMGVRNGPGPVHWDIRQAEYEGQYCIHVPGLNLVADLLNGSSVENTVIRIRGKQNLQPSGNFLTWWFERVNLPPSPVRRDPVSYLPPLKTGTYWIRNSSSRTLLTQRQIIEDSVSWYQDPNVVGSFFTSRGAFQSWVVTYDRPSMLYYVQNVTSGRYLSSAYAQSEAIVQASQVMRPWSIRQAESSEEFVLQLVGSHQTLTLQGGGRTNNTRVHLTARAGQPTSAHQTWFFEPVRGVEPRDPNSV